MKKFLWVLTMTLLLTGCGARREAEAFLRWREALAEKELSFTAEIVSLGEADEVRFTADVVRRGEETVLTVREPETIRGVTVTVGRDRTSLGCGGLVLSLAPWREGELSPCLGPKLALDALLRGRVETVGRAVELTLPEGETVTLWRREDGAPERFEIAREGRTVLTVQITDWKVQEK